MKTENVINAKKNKDRSITLTISDPFTGQETKKRYLAIRGGLSWPSATAPAYCCIIGQECAEGDFNCGYGDEGREKEAGRKVLLAEYEDGSLCLDSFFAKVLDVAEQMGCDDYYVELPEERYSCGYLSDFDNFRRARNSQVSLTAAYDADNFLLGISRINSGINNGSLVIPYDSIIHAQLQDITRPDLEDKPEERFHAINGVRHVISSFHRYAPSLLKISSMVPRRGGSCMCA